MAEPYLREGTKFYWIAPTINGKQCPRSSKTTDYAAAQRMLRILEGQVAANAPITAQTDRKSFAAIIWLVYADYQVNKSRSIDTLKGRIENHILNPENGLSHLPSAKVTAVEIQDYKIKRQEQGAADATINNELQVIRRAFILGQDAGLVSRVPRIRFFKLDNARQGFFTAETFQAVLQAAGSDLLREILTVAYITGWRISSVLQLPWENVDLKTGAVRLYSPETKNRKQTIIPLALFPELQAVLQARLQKRNLGIDKVFHLDGRKCRKETVQKWFDKARTDAGIPDSIIHDLRRTAVRNMIAQGWNPVEIMAMVGLKTMSMFLRYAIATDHDILTKGNKLAELKGLTVKASTDHYSFCSTASEPVSVTSTAGRF